MQVRFAFLCDYAQESGGKIGALGIGIDTFYVNDLSKPIQPFCLVINFEGSRSEAGQKHIEFHLMDADGQAVIPPLKGDIPIPAPPIGSSPRVGTGFVINFNGIVFPRYGSYAFSVVVNGHEMANLPFTVAQPPVTS